MSLHQLLDTLTEQGIQLWADGDQLRVRSPKGTLSSELRQQLAVSKAELLALLHQNALGQPELPTVQPNPSDRYQPFPLTDMQHAFWVGRSGLFELGHVANHGYYEIEGQGLDLRRLNESLHVLIERHDMLRAIVLSQGQQQVLQEVPAYQILVLDLRECDPATIASEIAAIRQQMSHQVLPANQWPLFEFRATQLADDRLRLHISYDLQIFDAWSMFRLFEEWFQLCQYPDVALPSLELTFRDYVLAEQALQKTDVYQRSLDYWLQRLDDFPPAPDLPLAINPATLKDHHNQRWSGQLTASSWQQLKQRAAQVGLTASGVLLAAFAEVLATWSRSPRFTINLALFNRLPLHPQVNDILGDFTSVTLLAVDGSTHESFAQRAVQLQQQLWQDLEHRYVSGVRVMRELSRRQGKPPGAIPIVFTSTLGFDAIGQQTSVFSQFGELVYGISQASQVWLDHQVVEQNGVLMFTWDAVADLFPPGMLEDMFTAYCGFLQQLAKSDHLWQQTTCQLIPAVQLQQRTRLNCVELPIPEATLYGLFTAQVRQQANTSAVITARQTLTYHDLDVRSRQVAFELQQQGVAANQLVAIVMEKGWEQVVAVLGVLAAGAAYVPIDPSLPSERLQYLLDNSQAQIVLTQSWLIDHLTLPVNIQSVAVDTLQPPSSPLPLHPVSYAPDDLAYVIYTSGSTGLPKGVMITHRSVVNVVITTNRRFQISASDRILALTALNHDLSVYDLFGLLSAGGAIVMPDADALKDPAHWVALMQQERVTLWNSVPALMGVLVDHQEHRAQPLPSSLRLAILGGDWVPVSLPARIQALSNSIQLLSIGGPTETTIWNISYLINTVDPSWTSIPYGQPMANSKYYILSDRLEDCPVWVPGQLYCAGVQLANGYWRNPEKTAASFISHPCTGERLYRTGDMGRYLPDGNIEFLGREDFQIKLRGYRIEAGEIEAALRQHPAVREAVVTVVGEPPEPQRLAAYMVLDRAQAQAVSDTQQLNPEQAQHRWMSVTQAGQHQAQQSVWDIDLPSFSTIWNYQNYLYTLSVCQALRQLGVYQSPGETHEVDSLMTQCQIAPRYRKWLQRALQILVTEGVLTQQGEAFTSQVELLTQVSPDRQTELQTTLARYQQGFIRTWLDRIPMGPATDLAATLTEMLHSAEQYTAATTQELYQILFADCNAIATAIIKTLVQTLDPEKPLRILEVGAGYGSTTRHLLPLLPPERTTYVFTDISNFFLQTAQLNFVDYPFMRYARLDLEHNPHAQGYELHSFDVVIAATVLHNTRSIYESLQHVRSLLAPGGVLLAIEKTKFHPLFDLTMGLQKGFERFEDTDLRPDHPILSKAQWQHVLAATGFVDSQFMNVADSVADAIGFDVLVAQGSATVQRFQPDSLREFLHQKLPEYMVPTHMIVLDALPLTANGKVDRLALPGVGEPRSPLTPAPDVLPRTATERRIAEIWQAVLNRGTVSIHDNFFALGGDSLQATQVITRLRDAFQLELSLQTALEAPTLEHLATTIDQMQQLVHQLQAPLEQASNREEVML